MLISEQVEEIFSAAIDLPNDERGAYLGEACQDDARLRQTVDDLLTAADQADSFFSTLSERLGLRSVFDGELELPRSDSIGAYRLVSLIGRGGMGAVYLAERADRQFEKRVALKVLPAGARGEGTRRRFLAERQILARLVHPNIARLLDGGITDDGTPYFVMDYVDGIPIDEYCNKHRLTVDQRLALFLQVAEAVEYAHRNLIVHRDIKPGNVLVDAAGDAKLVDFGVAKLLEPDVDNSSLTRVAGQPLTPRFASPEAIRGEPVTTAADVYALGLLLYMLLTPAYPYRTTASEIETQRRICEEEPVPPSRAVQEVAPDIISRFAADIGVTPRALTHRLKGDLDTIILMALRKRPENRYRTVEQLIADVERYQNGLPVIARAPSLVYRARKFVRRHVVGVSAAAAVAAALIAVAGLATYNAAVTQEQAEQIARERDKAEQIKDFLLSVFELTGPSATQGESVTARELIDRSAERIRSELHDQPERQAILMDAIAAVYAEMSLFDSSTALLVESRELHRASGNELSADFAQSTELLAEIREIEGNFDESEGLFRDALEVRRELGVPADTTATLLMLGRNLHKQGRLDDAEQLYRDALDMQRQSAATRSTGYANGLSYLGALLEHRGQLEDSEALHREALELRRDLHGEGHLALVESHYNLGAVLTKREQFEESREHYEAALAITHNLLPEGDQGAAFMHNGLGVLNERLGDIDAAVDNYRRSLEIIVRFFGEDHPNAGVVTGNVGRMLLLKGNHSKAEPLLRKSVDVVTSAAPEHRLLPKMRMDLGRCLIQTNQYAEAETLLLDVYAQLGNAPDGADNGGRDAAQLLVELYDAWDRPSRAATFRSRLKDTSESSL